MPLAWKSRFANGWFAVSSTPSGSAPSTDDHYDIFGAAATLLGDSGSGGNEQVAQSFTAASSGALSSVDLDAQKTNGPSDGLFVELWTDSSGVPGSLLATSSTVDNSLLPTYAGTGQPSTTFTFPTPATIAAGTVYQLVVRRSGARDGFTGYVLGIASSAYSGGVESTRAFGSWTASSGNDLQFRVTTGTSAAAASSPIEVDQGVAATTSGALDAQQKLAATATTDPAEATQRVSVVGASDPVELAQGVRATLAGPFEALQRLAAALAAPFEALQKLAIVGSTDPAEALQRVNVVGASDPAEALQRVNAAGASDPAEWLQALHVAALAEPYESTRKLAIVGSTDPAEALQRVNVAGVSDPAEALQGVKATVVDPAEWLQALHVALAEPYEALQKLAIVGSTDPAEALQRVNAGASDPAEALQRVNVAGSSDPLENLKGIAGVGSADPAELAQGIHAVGSSDPVERLQRVNAAGASDPAEANQGVKATAVDPAEWLQAIVRSLSAPAERLQRVNAAGASDPAEANQGVKATASGPLSSLQMLKATASAALEQLKGIVVGASQTFSLTPFVSTLTWGTTSTKQIATRFTPAVDGTIAQVTVRLSTFGGTPTDNVVVSVIHDSSGQPTGSVIASGTIPASSLTNQMADVTATLSAAAAVSAGTPYWILVSRDGALDNTNRYSAGLATNALGYWDLTSIGWFQGSSTSSLYAIWTVAGIVEPVEALQGIKATGSDPLEALGLTLASVSQTAVLSLELLQGLATTSTAAAEQTKQLSSSATLAGEGLLAARATASGPLEQLQGLTGAATAAYEALQRLQVADPAAAEALAPISASAASRIELLQRLASSVLAPSEWQGSGAVIPALLLLNDLATMSLLLTDLIRNRAQLADLPTITGESGDDSDEGTLLSDGPSVTEELSDRR